MSFSVGKRVWAIPMPATDKLVLLALAHYASDDGKCWPSLDKLGKDTGLHPKSVSRCIRRLKKGEADRNQETHEQQQRSPAKNITTTTKVK
jgi:hypothetical protein